jgi:hypothetical protein
MRGVVSSLNLALGIQPLQDVLDGAVPCGSLAGSGRIVKDQMLLLRLDGP